MKKLQALWRGDLPLADAFWTWTLIGGLFVNITTSLLFLTMITLDRTVAALLLGYGLSIPYNIIAVVGVWRSAARYEGANLHTDLARAASVILMGLLSVT